MVRKTSGNIRGYIFNVMIRQLLEKSGYQMIQPGSQNRHQVRRVRNDVIELRGRGCWHPVDCPYVMERTAPFQPSVRLIGEVRYHMSEIKKESVRNFIGVLTDLKEASYLLDEHGNSIDTAPRTDVGVFFAANGFWPEAARLAYNHGIRAISYKGNRQLDRMKELIFELESNYLDYDVVMQQGNFVAQFTKVIGGEIPADLFAGMYNLPRETIGLMTELASELEKIHTSMFASTRTGIMMHFLSEDVFPEELFLTSDEAVCQIKMELADGADTAYYLVFPDDPQGRRFYFAPPEGLSEQILYGPEHDGEVLYAGVKIRGMERVLSLRMDPDWRSALMF